MGGNFSSGGIGGEEEIISGINVTPLVDVVLVLLIIFMITAPAIYQSAIKVQLPTAKSGEDSPKSAFQFTLTKENELMWDKEKITWETLQKNLAEKSKAGSLGEETALISADQSTSHGSVIKLMDILRSAGLVRFALNVDSQKK